MNRRKAIKRTLWLGSAISVTSAVVFAQKCSSVKEGEENKITKSQEEMVTVIADMLIPDGDIPGAKAAGVGPFIVMMITDCYPEDIQKAFVNGLARVDKMSESMFNKPFIRISRRERGRILDELIADAKMKKDSPRNFFRLIRELTFLGYFTSEIGATKALEYMEVPGRYEGCIPLVRNQRAWAT